MYLSQEEHDKIEAAIINISNGVCKRVDVNDKIKVYGVKNVIRIDVKMSNG